MPSLKDMLAVKPLSGFEPVENPTKAAPQVTGTLGQNPYRRCPLPPFSATVDTLRQFDESGKVPARRVIPLPIATIVAAAGNIVTNVTTTGSGSSSGGGTTPSGTTLISATVSIAVPALAPGETFQSTTQVAKSFQLLLLTATNALEVRMYGTSLAQTIDLPRPTDSAPPFEVSQNIITDVVFDTAPFQWNWQNRVAANADSPQSKNIYFTIVNPSSSGIGASIVTLTYVALES
jgi:hypothetical protein